MSAEANYSTKTLIVNFIGGFNQHFHNREEAESTLGFWERSAALVESALERASFITCTFL